MGSQQSSSHFPPTQGWDFSRQLVARKEAAFVLIRPWMTHSDRIVLVSGCPPCHHNDHISVSSPRPASLISRLHSSSSKCHENWQFLIFSRFPAQPSFLLCHISLLSSPLPAPSTQLTAIFPPLMSSQSGDPGLHYRLSISVSGQLCSIPPIIGDNTEISSPPTQLTGNRICVGNILCEDISVCNVVIARVLVRLGGR